MVQGEGESSRRSSRHSTAFLKTCSMAFGEAMESLSLLVLPIDGSFDVSMKLHELLSNDVAY